MKTLALVVLLFAGVARADSIDDQMVAAAKQLNAQCPMMVDKVTRVDVVIYQHIGNQRILQYKDTIIGVSRSKATVIAKALRDGRAQEIAERCRQYTAEEAAAGIVYRWGFYTEDGVWLGDYEENAATCGRIPTSTPKKTSSPQGDT